MGLEQSLDLVWGTIDLYVENLYCFGIFFFFFDKIAILVIRNLSQFLLSRCAYFVNPFFCLPISIIGQMFFPWLPMIMEGSHKAKNYFVDKMMRCHFFQVISNIFEQYTNL